jgi:hypothetical protein
MASTISRWIRPTNIWVLNRHSGGAIFSPKRLEHVKPKIAKQFTEGYAQPFGYLNDINPL